MESETLKQFRECGFDANDPQQVKWFEGLTDKQRKELVKLSKLKKLITFSSCGIEHQ